MLNFVLFCTFIGSILNHYILKYNECCLNLPFRYMSDYIASTTLAAQYRYIFFTLYVDLIKKYPLFHALRRRAIVIVGHFDT